jgi:hypothetical protein
MGRRLWELEEGYCGESEHVDDLITLAWNIYHARDAALALAEQRAGALRGLIDDEPPICDLTNGHPWAGCAYCYGPHYHSRYHKRLGSYRGEYGKEPSPEPGEDEYKPFTEHKEGCPWEAARAALAAALPDTTPKGDGDDGDR